MNIDIRAFGRAQRPQVGVLQHPPEGMARRAAWLLVRPMGQEAVRTAAVYRVLSERLARAGCIVLRFDFHGTGNAPGEEGQQSLEGWVDDTLAAHECLRQEGVPNVHWFGMGLGANIMLRAALRATQPPAHLVPWEPIWQGRDYIDALKAGHRDELRRELAYPWEKLLAKGLVTEPQLPGDILGFQIGAQLANDLITLDPFETLLRTALQSGLAITCAAQAEHLPMLDALRQPGLTAQPIAERTNWLSSQAMGTAIVPPEMPRVLLSTLP